MATVYSGVYVVLSLTWKGIGDLIFPGLGTIGGALLGGWGGHEAGKRSTSGGSRGRHKRDRYDEEWEEGRRRRGEI